MKDKLTRLTLALSSALILTALSPAAHAASGTPLWTNFYAVPTADSIPSAMAVDGQGNVIVTGVSADYYTLSPVLATVKYSGAAVPLWTNLYGNGCYTYYNGSYPVVAVDNNGNVFVAGARCGADNYPLGWATVAYSNSGMPLWTNFHYEGHPSFPIAVTVDRGGNVFVTGGAGVETVAYSGAGVPFWTNLAGVVYGSPIASQPILPLLAADSSGNLFMTGVASDGYSQRYAIIKYASSLPVAVIQVSLLATFPGETGLVVIAANNVNACVRLDGSSSSTPDNGPLTYQWFNERDSTPFSATSMATNCLGLGTHMIRLGATDSRGVTDNAIVTVEVISCCTAVGFAVAVIQHSNLAHNETRPLLVSLATACESFERGDLQAGVNELRVFQRKVQVQISKSDPALAQRLTQITDAIINTPGER